MGGINCIKLLSANKGLLKKAAHNITTYSGHQELTQKNKISKVHFFVRHPVKSNKRASEAKGILPSIQLKIG